MAKNLLIIESPNKIETIQKYLKNEDFEIIATIGHIRDLSTRGMGFNERTLEPKWIVPTKKPKKGQKTKQEIIAEIKEKAKDAEKIYLASDPDREGEAIAWHVYEILNKPEQEKCFRITFNEITKDAILEALEHPRKIDMLWVQSQFARRILDRLVGYSLSRLVRQKLRAKSAGRVQTVALKFIYDREKEIKKFKSTKWWTLDVVLKGDMKLILRSVNDNIKDLNYKKINDDVHGTGIDFKDAPSAEIVKKNLKEDFKIYSIDEPKIYTSNPRDPYKTSTMQQDAINKLGWNVSKSTSVAQKLYEGIKIKHEHTALISYPRTDSIRISDNFAKKIKDFILKKFGEKYYQERKFANKGNAQNTQDAHEAIRVIDPTITPDSLKKLITRDEYKLYKMIWVRTLAAFMTPSKFENVIVRVESNKNKFYTYNRRMIFDGFRKIYNPYEDANVPHDIGLKNLKINKILKMESAEVTEHESTPPPRFNQASLIKALDEAGVGRPSTYKSMANMAVERGYARLENRAYVMQPIGDLVIDELQQYFPYIVDKNFTKEMEGHLDEIASKEENWKEWILEFKPKFKKDMKTAIKEMKQAKLEKVGRKCPKCGSELVYRFARKSGAKFIGCSNYPNCKYAEFPETPRKILEEKCPQCGKNLIERYNRRGQKFIGCTGYPKCHYVRSIPKEPKPEDQQNPTTPIKAETTSKVEKVSVKKDTIKKTKKN